MKQEHIIAIIDAIEESTQVPLEKAFNPVFNTLYEIADDAAINQFAKDALTEQIEAGNEDIVKWFKEYVQYIEVDDSVMEDLITKMVQKVRDHHKKNKKNYAENSALPGLFKILDDISDGNPDDYEIKLEFARGVVDRDLENDGGMYSDTFEWIQKHAAEYVPAAQEVADTLIGMGIMESEQYMDDILMRLPPDIRRYLKEKA